MKIIFGLAKNFSVSYDNLRLSSWLMAGLAALLPTYLIRFKIIGIPTTLWELILYLVALIFLARGVRYWTIIRNDPLRIPLAILAVAGIGAIIVSPNRIFALGQYKALVFDSLLFYYLLRNALQGEVSFESVWLKIMDGYLVGAVIMAVHAIWSALVGNVTYDGRILGIFALDAGASPNYLALWLAPSAVYAILSGYVRPSRWLLSRIGVSIILLAALILSGSQAIWLAVGCSLLLVWLCFSTHYFTQRRWFFWAVIGLLAIVILLIVFKTDFIQTIVSRDFTNRELLSPNRARVAIWQATIGLIIPQMSFFGLGWGNFQTVFTHLTATWVNYPEYIAPYALHPHNFFLTTLVTLGWLGLIAWIWIIVLTIRGMFPLRRETIILAAVFWVWLIQGLVDTTYYKNDLAPLTWLLIVPLVLTAPTPLGRSPDRSVGKIPNTSSSKNSTLLS